jgi:hypothetical protein
MIYWMGGGHFGEEKTLNNPHLRTRIEKDRLSYILVGQTSGSL